MKKAILAALITMGFGFSLTAFSQTPSPTASPTASSTASPASTPTPLPPGLPFIVRAKPWPNRNTHDLINGANGSPIMFAEFVGTSPLPTITRVTTIIPWLYSRPPLAVNQIIGDAAGDGVMVWGAPGAFGIPIVSGWTPNRLFVSDASGNLITATDGFYVNASDRMTIGAAGSGHIIVPGAGAGAEQFGSTATASGSFSLAIADSSLASGSNSIAIGGGSIASNTDSIAIGRAAISTHLASIAIGGFNPFTTAARQFVLGGPVATGGHVRDAYLGAGVAESAPLDFSVHATGATGSNVGGWGMKLAGGISTGSAAGGNAILAVSLPGASGSTPNPLTDIVTISGSTGTVTGAAVNLAWDGNPVYDAGLDAWGFKNYILSGSVPIAGLGTGDIGGIGPTNNLQWDESQATLYIRTNLGADISTLSGLAGQPSVINKRMLNSDTEIYGDNTAAIIVDADEDRIDFNTITAYASEIKEISSGALAISKGFVQVDTEGAPVADDLVTINKTIGTFIDGEVVILMSRSDSDTITVKNATGNIFLDGASDKVLNNSKDKLTLIRQAGQWNQLAFSSNSVSPATGNTDLIFIGAGAGGAATTIFLVGASKGERFNLNGDENYLHWTWPPDLMKNFDVTLKIGAWMTGAEAAKNVSFDVDILVDAVGVLASTITGTLVITNFAVPSTANLKFEITANISAATFLPAAGDGWHIRITRRASSAPPAAANDPVVHHVVVEYKLKTGSEN